MLSVSLIYEMLYSKDLGEIWEKLCLSVLYLADRWVQCRLSAFHLGT
jgi:hypothetical protein